MIINSERLNKVRDETKRNMIFFFLAALKDYV